jgi:hypothetical protein
VNLGTEAGDVTKWLNDEKLIERCIGILVAAIVKY